MPIAPLPDELGERFSVSRALDAGVSRRRLRAQDLDRPFHGVRVRRPGVSAPAEPDSGARRRDPREVEHLRRALDYEARMSEHEFFCGVTAALRWGISIPLSLIEDRPLDVAVLAPRRLPRSRGVRGHQVLTARTTLVTDPASGRLVTDPATTWAMLGALISDVRDLVAAADSVVRDWRVDRPMASVADLERVIRMGRRVGIGRLREALPLVRTRSASRPETRTRLALIDAGLPEPALNFTVTDEGSKLACVDLAYPQRRIAVEYEGEHHLLDPVQWSRDIARYERLAAAGWIVVRVTKTELFGHPWTIASRVRAAAASRR
ncbi:MAG: hypothetical protein ABWY55_08405 [Microbacterium sp.]